MKSCSKCKISQEEINFHKQSSAKDGLQRNCKDCRKQIDAESYLKYEHRRSSIRKRRDINYSYNTELVNRYKRICKCSICRESEPCALDLHHTNPLIKDKNPSDLKKYSLSRLKTEIRKCIVLCSNCHRKVHAGILNI